jgi:hypothetical protein
MLRYASSVLLALVAVHVAGAEQRIIDSGTLLVTRDGMALGREEFTVRAAAPGGITISVRSFYPPDRAEPVVTTQVELRPDSQLAGAQVEDLGAGGRRILLQADPRRVTVRSVSPTGESVRQYPASGRLIVADDSALSLYAVHPGSVPSVGQIWPRGPRRAVSPLGDLGLETTPWWGETRQLRHLVLGDGPDSRHLWYDLEGRLMKVEIPGAMLLGLRAREER